MIEIPVVSVGTDKMWSVLAGRGLSGYLGKLTVCIVFVFIDITAKRVITFNLLNGCLPKINIAAIKQDVG